MPALHRHRENSNEKSHSSLLPSLMHRDNNNNGQSQSKLSHTGSNLILGVQQPKLTRDAYGLNSHKGTF